MSMSIRICHWPNGAARVSEHSTTRNSRHRFCGKNLTYPLIRGITGDVKDILPRLSRQLTATVQPLLDPPGTSIVCGGRKPEITKLCNEFSEELPRGNKRRSRLEWISETVFRRYTGHELSNALGSGTANDIGPKTALLMN